MSTAAGDASRQVSSWPGCALAACALAPGPPGHGDVGGSHAGLRASFCAQAAPAS